MTKKILVVLALAVACCGCEKVDNALTKGEEANQDKLDKKVEEQMGKIKLPE